MNKIKDRAKETTDLAPNIAHKRLCFNQKQKVHFTLWDITVINLRDYVSKVVYVFTGIRYTPETSRTTNDVNFLHVDSG
jgi:hypothetical protein